ncbi:hypothetical protein M758_1G266100 [Ceratodon purpureus]|uniref:Uncharacterized protein n=1 Tax=Ceratodon purpureus TaxID=3225 RepID=A0A8T0JCZ3_CERPU|nr:hypothetical protein KC19_1G273900 [Ceratodon purpureus]KAG0631608.1 hypothetical protein M758_1G266100 [Ceratodon purpureus]
MADKNLKFGVGSSLGAVGGDLHQHEEIDKLDCGIHGSAPQLRGLATVSVRSEGVVDSYTATSPANPMAPTVALEENFRPSMKDMIANSAAQTMSAGLYLFDHISNIVVLTQYYILSKTGKFSGIVINLRHFRNSSKVPFYVCLGFMIFDPAVAAVAFKLRLEPEEHPLRSALFLPIIQFKRFFSGVWKSSSWASVLEVKESLETEALFSIITAMETIPQLILQFAIIYYLAYSDQGALPAILVISVVVLFLSASYNTGRAVMYQMSKKWTFALDISGLVAGMYTVGAMLLRFSAVTAVISAFGNSFSGEVFKAVMTVYMVVGICLLSYIISVLDHFHKGRDICTWRAQVNIIVASYICATIGPLYPAMENDRGDVSWSSTLNPKRTLLVRLGLATGINMIPDVVIVILSSIRTVEQIYPTCSGTTTTNNSWISCHEFISFVTVGLALSVLPCIIFPRIANVAPYENRLDAVPINGATAVNGQTVHSSGPYRRPRTATAGNAGEL